MFLKCFRLKWDDIDQTSMRFHSAIATLENQKYVIARTVWTGNNLLASGGRLVLECFSFYFQRERKYLKAPLKESEIKRDPI